MTLPDLLTGIEGEFDKKWYHDTTHGEGWFFNAIENNKDPGFEIKQFIRQQIASVVEKVKGEVMGGWPTRKPRKNENDGFSIDKISGYNVALNDCRRAVSEAFERMIGR